MTTVSGERALDVPPTRREFVQLSAAVAAALGRAPLAAAARVGPRRDTIRIGLVGCGQRGTGAAAQALRADPDARLVALADAFEDRVAGSLEILKQSSGARAEVDPARRFVGFDAYQGVLASDVDLVLLATPPHFRPLHVAAAIEAGKHVFAEKPGAVDAPGVRSLLESGERAREQGLCLASGLHMRSCPPVQALMQRVHDGAIGELIALHAVNYGAGVWVRPRRPGEGEMQYQMRNWYYFTWLSGDFNVEQFVHQYDLIAWALGEYPTRCYGTGGRQVRNGADHGNVYDHFSSTFEYAGGARAFTTTRHQPGASTETRVVLLGSAGRATIVGPGQLWIEGRARWRPPRGPAVDGHQLEHDLLFRALREGRRIDDADPLAKSTMMGILARMSAYTGQSLGWEQALASRQRLEPAEHSFDAQPPPASIALPGVTPFE